MDNIVVAQEMIHTFKKKTGKRGYMAVKTDMKKAYDRVEWSYLYDILEKVGFDKNMTEIIMFYLKSSSLRVLWNEEQLD